MDTLIVAQRDGERFSGCSTETRREISLFYDKEAENDILVVAQRDGEKFPCCSIETGERFPCFMTKRQRMISLL